METTDKSLLALSQIFNSIDAKEIDSIINSIDKMAFEGPTLNEYFVQFQDHFAKLLPIDEYDFTHQKICSPMIMRPQEPINKEYFNIDKENIPEFINSGFFLLISQHERPTCSSVFV